MTTETADVLHAAVQLMGRAKSLIARLERLQPLAVATTGNDWSASAYRWRRYQERGWLQPIWHPHRLALEDLLCLEHQKSEILRNTQQFLNGRGANNALLWGSRGTGKSSLIKALLHHFAASGLRLIEVDKDDLVLLPDILDLVRERPERFILFCDDLSFAADESGYKALKAALDGSITATPENLLIYATSNRRHLLPEFQAENREARIIDDELHPGESVEEKISLSDRFGLWLAFHPFTQEQFLKVVRHWLTRLAPTGCPPEGTAAWSEIERVALQWALRRGSRSGRTAWQFARDWSGRQGGQQDATTG